MNPPLTPPCPVAVLGLGRMGAAIAARLQSLGWEVTGWTRSGRTVDSVKPAADPGDAVTNADVVLLALFDGPACLQVLDRVRASLRPDTIVVNISTIAPAEAAALARQVGTSYVHAPVLGSVPAVSNGALQVLAGADEDVLARVRPLLDALGTLRPVGLAARKRSFLAGQPGPAEFTIGALAKDMALLAGASDSPLRSAAELAGSPAGPEADIALAAMAPAAGDDVLEPLRAYIRGHATGDPAHFRAAFLPTAHIEGIRDGAFVSWPLDDYCALFDGPAPDETARSRRIDSVDVHGSVATASMTLRHGADTFTDVFLLVHVDGRWRIANKAYHRATGIRQG